MVNAALVERRDLAVDHHRGTAASDPLVAADQLQIAPGDYRKETVPVVLDLVQPAVALRRLGAGRDNLETALPRHPVRDCSAG